MPSISSFTAGRRSSEPPTPQNAAGPRLARHATARLAQVSQADPSGRKATRWPAASFPGITGLRISPHGIEAKLLNLSSTGLLAECADRLKTGSTVTVIVDGTFAPDRIPGAVVRNYVASMSPNGRLRYQVAISFTEAISLEPDRSGDAISEESPSEVPPPSKTVRNRW